VRIGLEESMTGVPKASGSEGTTGPAVADVCKVPLDRFGVSVSVQLVTGVDESLDRGCIDVVDRRAVEYNSTEAWSVIIQINLLSTARARLVPRAVLFVIFSINDHQLS
jgi:hypothetical protein